MLFLRIVTKNAKLYGNEINEQGCDMANVTVVEAAKLIGKSRNVIYRAIDSGKLSASIDKDGTKKIDTAELLRVFGAFAEQGSDGVKTEQKTPKRERAETVQPSHAMMMELGELRAAKEYLSLALADAKEQAAKAEARAVAAEVRAEAATELSQKLLTDMTKVARKRKA